MNNKIVKTIDEHNIDRNANVIFAFELDGSEYVGYSIERDEEQDNLFISKVIRNIDGTFNMLNIESTDEKSKLNGIIMSLVEGAVHNPADKLDGTSVTLSDGKVVKFMSVNFNKEQRIEVRKTYVTTVKKEVTRVAEKYYAVEVSLEQPKVVDEVFPTVTPVTQPVEEVKVVAPEVVAPVPQLVVETPVLSTPTVEVPKVDVAPAPVVESQVAPAVTPVAVQPQSVVSETVTPVVSQPAPAVVESITVPEPSVSVVQPGPEKVVVPTEVVPTPVVVTPEPVPAAVTTESQPLVFNASKETNLNAALGEVANASTIPVENIESVREFGVDAPIPTPVASQPNVAPMVQPEVASQPKVLTKKAGFANSKFFMLVAIAFFLASCIFLGYEVFNYFQLTK